MNRRDFMQFGALAWTAIQARHASATEQPPAKDKTLPSQKTMTKVVTPNGSTLPLQRNKNVLVGHLVAEAVQNIFAPGLSGTCWGFNGSTPGPTIEATQGDRLRLYVTNRLPEPTSIHWHGLILPNGMDGVAGLTQTPIPSGQTYVYEFTLRYPGTFMYHPHYDEMTQIAMGMVGMFIVHPQQHFENPVDRDFALMTHEWLILPGMSRPDPLAMTDFNLLTFNSRAYPATEPLMAHVGEKVRIRLGNLGPMDHHPIHLHGLSFHVTGTDGGLIKASAQIPQTTVLVPVGATRTIEFVAEEPGDWAMHCHMTHHTMTQMGHGAISSIGADNRIFSSRLSRVLPQIMTMGESGMGQMADMDMPVPANSAPMRATAGPFGSIDMGGMFTVLKIRPRGDKLDPESWYAHPPGTVARAASPQEMVRDGL